MVFMDKGEIVETAPPATFFSAQSRHRALRPAVSGKS
jgi:hypothetical protein